MRRLPIFLVIDVSESMAGTPIENVKQGIKTLTDALMSDPYAVETAYLSVISFAGRAKVITPLTYLLNFGPPDLSIGAGTSLSAALRTLTTEIETKVKKNTPASKGDWRPLVFLLTDGAPTDAYQQAIAQWKQKYKDKVSIVAILMGAESDASALRSLTDNVLVFKDTSPESYKAFFKWVSTSIQTGSKEIGETGVQSFSLDKLAKNLEKDFLAETTSSSNTMEYFVIPARCSKTKQLYFLRAIRHIHERQYHWEGAFKVDESYFEMSSPDEEKNGRTISTEEIGGALPECPYCGNQNLGLAGCGKFHCVPDSDRSVECPWCGEMGLFGGQLHSINGGRD